MSAAPASEGSRVGRSYAKPGVKWVHLKPEEAALGACRATGKLDATAGDCKPFGNRSGLGS